MFTFFGNACDCLVWNFAAVSVPTFIIGGLWGSTATSALVMCVSSWSLWGAGQISACGEMCASWQKFLYKSLRVKPRLHAWHSHRQARSHFTFSSLSDQWELQLFFIFRNSFIQNYRFFTMVMKISRGGESAGGGRSTSKSTCVVPAWTLTGFGDRPAFSMSKLAPAWTLTSEMVPFESKSVTLSMYYQIDVFERIARVWSYQLTSDLRDVYLLDILAMVLSPSSFGAYVCLRRPAGLLRDERSCRRPLTWPAQ